MPYRVLQTLPTDPDHSRVLCVNARVSAEASHWVVDLDVVMIPDHDDYIETHRMGEYPSRNRATMAAMWWIQRAETQMGLRQHRER